MESGWSWGAAQVRDWLRPQIVVLVRLKCRIRADVQLTTSPTAGLAVRRSIGWVIDVR